MGARDAILSAADQIFGEVGYDAASTREIAELSGANKALIHYHFKNKEGLLASVLDRYYAQLGAEIQAALSGSGDLRQRLARLLDAYADFLANNQRFCRIVQREAAGGTQVDKIRNAMLPLFQMGRQIIADAYPHAAGMDLAAEHLMVSVYGMIITYFTYSDVLTPLLGSDPMSRRNLTARKHHVRQVVDLLVAELERAAETSQ